MTISSANLANIESTNTFDQWRIRDNKAANAVNEIVRGEFNKTDGNVTISVGSVYITSTPGGFSLSVTANARVSSLLSTKHFEQDSGDSYFNSQSGNVIFSNVSGRVICTGNTSTRFLFNNVFINAANINANGYIQTTGQFANGNLIMNVANVLTVGNLTANYNVNVTSNITVSNTTYTKDLVVTNRANALTGNIVTLESNLATDNYLVVSTRANIAYANIVTLDTNQANANNINVTNTISTNNLVVRNLANIAYANIPILEVSSLSVASGVVGPAVSACSTYILRNSISPGASGSFGVYRGSTAEGYAYLTFNYGANVWQMTANNQIPTTNGYSTILGVANVSDSVSTTSSSNVASLTAVKSAYDTAVASASTVKLFHGNTGYTGTSTLMIANTPTINATVVSGVAGNSNVQFSINTSAVLVGAGSDKQFIYNSAGSAAGASGLTYDSTTNTVNIKHKVSIANLVSGTVSGSVAIDLSTASYFKYALSGATTFSFSNPPSNSANAYQFSVMVTQPVGGGLSNPSPAWPAGIKWAGGSQPPSTTTASANDIWTFITFDGGTTYYGTLSMKDVR